ncbi:hypothetical protein JX265_007401 [Neoarthrinium moseri]|uniref:DNA-directed RNA polymerase III subunit RPC6 n=1 Tax=Neoarthrinium moseri TaxID=1658444 RepID=A0A9P9WKC3_9PEZI|nr:uncharacterized protein JN550_009124 [Neoarthrinium moseri]KAI1864104.1 hypothetical protein JN550_009124 [Neoarthrinium moseri]KAI1867599.1 hypothetical protein JX265_007401 [Neoarthrinium moseri]
MDADKISVLKDLLYDACKEKLDGDDEKAYHQQLFTQEDLLGLGVIPPKDLRTLVQVIRELTEDFLFITVNSTHGTSWRLRPEEEARKYVGLTTEQIIIYTLIDNAGHEGIWQQDMRRKTGMREQTLKKVLKELESQKKLITSFTSVHHVTHRCYIKASIKPSDKVTGGPWFADGDLDESFIEILLSVTYAFIKEKGSYHSRSGSGVRSASSSPVLPKKVLNGSHSDAAMAARGKKRSADAMAPDEDPTLDDPAKPRKRPAQPVLLPMPAGFKHYLTLPEITQALAKSGVTKGIPLKEADIQQLVDVLIYDNRLEEVKVGKRVGYRITRPTKANPEKGAKIDNDFLEPPSNALTTAPCGRCPVFDLCEEGGPVWAGGCEYFDQWLI